MFIWEENCWKKKERIPRVKREALQKERVERNEKIDKDSREKKSKIIFVPDEEIAGRVEKECWIFPHIQNVTHQIFVGLLFSVSF